MVSRGRYIDPEKLYDLIVDTKIEGQFIFIWLNFDTSSQYSVAYGSNGSPIGNDRLRIQWSRDQWLHVTPVVIKNVENLKKNVKTRFYEKNI